MHKRTRHRWWRSPPFYRYLYSQLRPALGLALLLSSSPALSQNLPGSNSPPATQPANPPGALPQDAPVDPPKEPDAAAPTVAQETSYSTALPVAQETSGSTAIEDISLETLLEPVVAASKYEQPQEEAPSAVSVVTAEEIERQGYKNFEDLLRAVRGFYVVNDRNYSYIGIRGFSIPGDYGSRVLALINGNRLNDAIYDSTFVGMEFPLDMRLVKRVEIIRGPSSSIYGSNAFLGVINVITKEGRDLEGVEAFTEVGSLNSFKGAVTYGDRFGPGVDLLLSATFRDRGGQPFLYYAEYDSPETHNGIVRDLDGERAGHFYGQLAWGDLSLRGAYSLRRREVPTASYGAAFADPSFYNIDVLGYADLSYRHTFDGLFNLQARASINSYRFEGEYPYDYSEEGAPLPIVVNRDEALGNWWGAELQLSRTFFDRLKLILGAEYRDNFQQAQKNFDLDPELTYLDREDSTRILGAYLQGDLNLFKWLILNAGLRYDHYFDAFGGSLNPRVALILSPLSHTHIKLMAGTAFRAPNAYERFYSYGEPGSGDAHIQNPDLQPEKIQTYEIHLDQRLGEKVRVQLGGYYYKISELIQLAENDDGDVSFRNTDQVEAMGLELEVAGNWRGLQGRASYALQRARNSVVEAVLVNSPHHLAKFNLIVPLYMKRLFAGLEAQVMSSRKTIRGDEVRAYWLANLNLLGKELITNLTLTASIKNLFDVRYGDPGSPDHLQRIIRQDGRIFWIGLGYRHSL